MSDETSPFADRASPFRPVVVIGLILAAVFSMSAMAVLSAWAPPGGGDDGREHALSKSGVGYAGLARLLRETGRPVVLSRGETGRDAAKRNLLIMTLSEDHSEREWKALRRYRGAKLVVLPKWRTVADPRHPGWVRRVGLLSEQQALASLPGDLRSQLCLTTGAGAGRPRLTATIGNRSIGTAGAVDRLRTVTGEAWSPLVEDDAGRAVLIANETNDLYVLADADLLNTQGLNDRAKARAALAVVDEAAVGTDGAIFDLTLHGFSRPRSVLRLLLEPPMLGFTLCLFFAALLVGWQAMVRFEPHGRQGRAVAPGKRALADNTAALARLARREHGMAAPYAELMRQRAAKAVAAPANLGAEALTALLNRLAARRGGETYETLKARADAARSPADLMAVARALNDWKAEMTRGRG